MGVPYLPRNFNPSTPAGANRVTQMVMEQVLPQAFVIDPSFVADTTGFIDSAELISVSPETIAYTIDPKATWSDGVPISAQDFIYNWQEQLQQAGSLPFSGALAGYEDIASVTGSANGKTVTVSFKKPYADWESLFADLVPAHVAESYGWTQAFAGFDPGKVISGGPFEVASMTPGVELVLKRNPRWWGTPPHLSSIVFRVVPAGTDEWSLLESGSVDVGEMVPNPTENVIADIYGMSTATTLTPFCWQLVFNGDDPVVGSADVRRAVALALDRAQLVADTIGLLDPGAPVKQNRLFIAGAPGSADNATAYSTVDDAAAGTELGKAGYVLLPSGYYGLVAAGAPAAGSPLVLTITGPSENPLAAQVEAEFQAEMKAAGIMVQISNVSQTSLLNSVLPEGDYQMALAPFVDSPYQSFEAPVYTTIPTVTPGTTSDRRRLGAQVSGSGGSDAGTLDAAPAATNSVWQPTFVNLDDMDMTDQAITTLFSQAASQLNQDTDRGLYNEIDTLLWQDMPTIPLFDMPVTLVTEPGLVNVEESPTWAGPMWNAEDWALASNLPGVATTTTSTTSTTSASTSASSPASASTTSGG